MTQGVAQSWLVLQMTGRAIDLGILGAVTWGPVLLGGAWAGGLVDRVDRRRLLTITQIAFIVLCAAQAALISTGQLHLWMIYVFGAFTGIVTAIDSPARQVYVLELVGRDHLGSAVGLAEVVINASRIIGPSIGGLLLATVGTGECFAVNGLTYLPVLYVLIRYTSRAEPARNPARNPARKPATDPARDPATDPAAEPAVAGVSPAQRARLIDGLRAVRRTPAVLSCLLVAFAAGMIFNLGVALPLLTSRVFHMGGGGYGAMMAAFGIGAMPGAVAAAGSTSYPSPRRIRLLTVLSGLAVLLTAASPDAAGAFIGIALTGFLSIWLIAIANTLVQLQSEPEMRGRIMGLWTMVLPGAIPFTGMVSALVAQLAGARAGFGLAGVVLVIVGAVTWRQLGRAEQLEQAEPLSVT